MCACWRVLIQGDRRLNLFVLSCNKGRLTLETRQDLSCPTHNKLFTWFASTAEQEQGGCSRYGHSGVSIAFSWLQDMFCFCFFSSPLLCAFLRSKEQRKMAVINLWSARSTQMLLVFYFSLRDLESGVLCIQPTCTVSD